MEVEGNLKRSERKKRKSLKYYDDIEEEESPLTSQEAKEDIVLIKDEVKKKRGRKPSKGVRNIKPKIEKDEIQNSIYFVEEQVDVIPYLDVHAAISKGLNETSKPPLSDSLMTKSIGYLCKVFWDQDNVWYTGRVLLYDPVKYLHLIYFDVDGTAEWIDTSPNSEDYVLLADEFVLYGSWPALKYGGSIKGMEYIRPKSERFSDTYVEYFPHTKSSTTFKHAFTKHHELKPLADISSLKSRKRLRYAAEQAQAELWEVYRIKKLVAEQCRKLGVHVFGSSLVGVKISVPASLLFDDTTPLSTGCNIGTIVDYCPGLNEYFVVFQNLSTKPLWMRLHNDSSGLIDGLQLVIDWDSMESLSISDSNHFHDSASDEDEDISKIDHPSLDVEELAEHNDPTLQTDNEILSNDQPISRNYTQIGNDPSSEFAMCDLCRLADEDVKTCPSCHAHSFHPNCMPQEKISPLLKQSWRCWHCIGCEGCHRSAWLNSMCSMSLSELLTLSIVPDRNVLICSFCQQRYLHGSKDYCQICYKLYSAEEDEVGDSHMKKEVLNGKSIPSDEESEENQMIQCNECRRWIHCNCEGIDQIQYNAIAAGSHPVWGDEYLCPNCRIDISTTAIDVLYHADVTQIFGEPVSVQVAKSYYEIIRNPMDLSTMYQKAQNGIYKSLQSLRDDFELMCLNAITFNKVGDEYWMETTEFFTRGFHYFNDLKRSTHISAYGIEYQKMYNENKGIIKASSSRRLVQKSALAQSDNPYTTSYTSKKRAKPSSNAQIEEISDSLTRTGRQSRKSQSSEASEVKSDTLLAPAVPQTHDLEGSDLIPSFLEPLPHDANEILVEGNLMYPSDSFYFCCVDICGICSSFSSPNQMLFCIDCGESYHSFCIQPKSSTSHSKCTNFNLNFIQNISLTNNITENTSMRYWKCANCNKFCAYCHQDRCEITCKICNFSFHKACLTPPPKSHGLINFNDFTCSQCMETSCQKCEIKSKIFSSLQMNTTSPLNLEFYIGKNYFKSISKWGVKDTCIECLCCGFFKVICDILDISRMCSICNTICHPNTNDEDGEIISRQCIGCFKFFHLACERATFNDFVDLQTIQLEYLCVTCTVDFFGNKNKIQRIDQSIYEQLNLIQLHRLQIQHSLQQNISSESQSVVVVDWSHSFSASLHSALIMWAAKRYQALSLYGRGPIILTDNSIFRSRDFSSISTTKTIVKARKFARLCENASRISQFLSGGIYFGNENKKRPASSFFELAVLAASFLLVTTRELNNSIRSPINIESISPIQETKYLQITHWKVPPDEAINLVSKHLHDQYSQDQVAAAVMEKILVEWKRLVISEYCNGFPTSPPTSPFPGGTPSPVHEIPIYDFNYCMTPFRSLIGVRPLVFDSWQHSSLFSHNSSRNIPTYKNPKISSVTPQQPVVQASPPSSKEGNNPPKVKSKFIILSESELKRYFREKDQLFGSTSIFAKFLPHNPTDLVFHNYWVAANLVPEEDQQKQIENQPQEENYEKEIISQEDSQSELILKNKEKMNSFHFHNQWRRVSRCVLCKGGNTTTMLGPLLLIPSKGLWIHSNCLKCSEGIYETIDGVLEGTEFLLRSHLEKICSLCGRKGASIRCDRKNCTSIYHLECAIACQFAFKELKQDCESDTTGQIVCKYKISSICAAHKDLDSKRASYYSLENSSLRIFRIGDADLTYVPTTQNTLKLIAISKSNDDKMKMISRLLRTGSTYRVGSLTIHKLGILSFELPGHHSSDCIFPYGFKSTRIFWSMIHPYRRAVYNFEIHSEDFEENNPYQKLLYPVPLFVVTVSDQYNMVLTSRFLFSSSTPSSSSSLFDRPSRSIHELYHKIISNVLACQTHIPSAHIDNVIKLRSHLYPNNPFIFFGVGINVVRYALETQSESLAMMIPSYFFSSFPLCENLPRYRPRYHLPTLTQFREAVRRRLQHRHITRKNLHGSSRAEGYIREKRFISERKVRNLAKAVDDNGNNQNNERRPDIEEDDDENENLRKKSRLEAKYRELSEGYLINPSSKLLVKRSDIHGWGLFAKVEFPKDAMVVEYIGEKVRQIVADIREETYDKEGVGSCYLFRLDKDHIIDATRTGGMARFMNHCCEPNAYAKIITCSPRPGETNEQQETKHIVIFANRTIQPGEEITYDYKFPIEENKLKCYCGAPKCQGTMN